MYGVYIYNAHGHVDDLDGHSGLAEEKNQRWIIWTTKQAISVKVGKTFGPFVHNLDCEFENISMAWPTCFNV